MSGKKFEPVEYDIKLGRMLTTMRLRFGLSQKDIANKTGITFQQIQKYETAGNRLHQIVTECFDGVTISAFLNETDLPYNNDKTLTQIVRALYGMNPDGVKLVAKLIACIAGAYPK